MSANNGSKKYTETVAHLGEAGLVFSLRNRVGR